MSSSWLDAVVVVVTDVVVVVGSCLMGDPFIAFSLLLLVLLVLVVLVPLLRPEVDLLELVKLVDWVGQELDSEVLELSVFILDIELEELLRFRLWAVFSPSCFILGVPLKLVDPRIILDVSSAVE